MKTNLRSFIFILFTVVGGMGVLAGNAQAADAAMPPEVKALIGMKLPPLVVGKAAASIPNFISHGGSLLDEQSGEMLAYNEGIVGGKWPVFVVQRINKERYLEVLDAQLLPADLLDWRFVDGEFKNNSDHFKFVKGRYSLSQSCQPDEGQIIFGLIKPENGKETCEHDTSRVKRAWNINRQNGKISSKSTKGLSCHYLLENQCM